MIYTVQRKHEQSWIDVSLHDNRASADTRMRKEARIHSFARIIDSFDCVVAVLNIYDNHNNPLVELP